MNSSPEQELVVGLVRIAARDFSTAAALYGSEKRVRARWPRSAPRSGEAAKFEQGDKR